MYSPPKGYRLPKQPYARFGYSSSLTFLPVLIGCMSWLLPSTSAVPPIPAFDPTKFGGSLLWIDANNAFTTNTGNGTPCSACTDRSPNGCTITEVTPGNGPLRMDPSGRRGTEFIRWNNSQSLQIINTVLDAVGTGPPKAFTMGLVFHPSSTAATYMGGYGNTGNFVNYALPQMNNQVLNWRRADPTNPDNVSPLTSIPIGLFPIVLLIVHTPDGISPGVGALQLYVDGTAYGAPLAFPWSTTAVKNIYTIGSIRTTVDTIQSVMRIRHYTFNAVKFTASDVINYTSSAANEIGTDGVRLNWKKGVPQSATFGKGNNSSHVVAVVGDSQAGAFQTTGTYTSLYAGTKNQAYAMFPDGNMAPMVSLPLNDPTDAMPVLQDSSTSGTMDPWTRAADYLTAHGMTKNIFFAPSYIASLLVDGTSGNRMNLNLATVPPPLNEANGRLMSYLDAVLLKVPNPDLVFYFLFGGTHALNPPFQGGTVANLTTGYNAILNFYNTKYAAFFSKTQHFMIGIEPVSSPTDTSTFPPSTWANMRTALINLVASRSDCVAVPYPEGPFAADGLHMLSGSNAPGAETGKFGLGVRYAAADLAAI